MRLSTLALSLLLASTALGALPAHADSGGENDDKGCAHIPLSQSALVVGSGLLLFAVAARRGREE